VDTGHGRHQLGTRHSPLIPPAPTLDGDMACIRKKPIAGLHAFSSANEGADATGDAPAQWTIHTMTDGETAELIERHIDYVDSEGRSVHLGLPFVRQYQNRHDGALPTMHTIATLPLVLADGHFSILTASTASAALSSMSIASR
jgi:hypothetical protein